MDRKRHLRTDHLRSDLTGRTARGGTVMIASQALKFALNVGSAVVLARLLTPQDYGLIAMVAVVTSFSYPFRNLGLSAATIQRPDVSPEQVSNLFWVNTSVSVVVMVATAVIAPFVSWFYGEPRLTWITVALAGGFVFSGLSVQHEALLKRQMRFFSLASTEIASILLGTITAILAAWHGLGYWSLVVSSLVTSATYAVGVWLMCNWLPGWPVRDSGVKAMLRFGGNLTGSNLINFISRNLDNLLIGRFWGPQQLGLYNRAYQLLLLPLEQINAPLDGVAITALSKLTGTPERYRKAYIRILEKLAILTMPGIALMVVTSDWLVRLVLGSQWTGTAPIFALLGIVGMLEPVTFTMGWLLISQARTKDVLQLGIVNGVISVISILAGLRWGALGVAASYAITGLVVRKPIIFWWVGRAGPVRTSDIYRTIFPAFCAALAVVVSLLAFRRSTDLTNPLIGIISCSMVAVGASCAVLFALPAGRLALRDTWSLLPHLFRKSAPNVVG